MASSQSYFFERGLYYSSGYLKDFYSGEVILSANPGEILANTDDHAIKMEVSGEEIVLQVPARQFPTKRYSRSGMNHFIIIMLLE